MPNLEIIEQFKTNLQKLGDEEEILREQGEVIKEIAIPEHEIDEDLSQLLNDATSDLDKSENNLELNDLPGVSSDDKPIDSSDDDFSSDELDLDSLFDDYSDTEETDLEDFLENALDTGTENKP
ncbi:MAG: hypothetical protein KAG14_03570, partial [Mycoplasmataceae bacterium]|nr:hypothetical protein [Mycoplasmataceae bacterium]